MKTYTAIITGATSGIGAAYARQLAARGYHLLITGRRRDRLEEMKNELENTFGVRVDFVVADLSKAADVALLLQAIGRMPSVDLLVNNAGFGNPTNFFDSDYGEQQKMVEVHITATTRLIHQIVPLMQNVGGGAIINVASLAAFLPSRLSYFYCATKAFLVAFSECLYVDLKHCGIKVQALCPGLTQTEFHDHQDNHSASMAHAMLWMTPEQVVRHSLKSLYKAGVICIPGFFNRLIYAASRLIPKNLYYYISARQASVAHAPAVPQLA